MTTWSRARAAWTMVAATAMWSIAGVVTRQLESAQGFEITFWRSLFTALSLAVILRLLQGPNWWRSLARLHPLVWLSGLCWSVMFTAFMMALTMTTVAAVLVTMAVGPLVSALVARVFFQQAVSGPTWLAIAVAGAGMAWMYADPAAWPDGAGLLPWGTLVALLVPCAAAFNWSVVRYAQQRGESIDMVPAVGLGAVISTLLTLALAWPLQAPATDVAWLALLGLVQLALPCVLLVYCARVLPAAEISLLALLEVVFGILLAWLGADEVPSLRVLVGCGVVLLALALNAAWSKREGAA